MKVVVVFLISLLAVSCSDGPNDQKAFEEMLGTYYTYSVPLIRPIEIATVQKSPKQIVLIDARSEEEYAVSHIDGAINIPYDTEDPTIDTSNYRLIVVYCSIGYRSEMLGEKLYSKGYRRVFNLYGGIFHWVNSYYPVVDSSNNITGRIHGYSDKWKDWVRVGEVE